MSHIHIVVVVAGFSFIADIASACYGKVVREQQLYKSVPVSYTHLPKPKVVKLVLFAGYRTGIISSTTLAVSYTHRDVYKRQVV